MTPLRPIQLPKVRDRMATLLADPDSQLRSRITGERAAELEIVARHLYCGLYWTTSDMAALATSAGRDLDRVRWATEDRPAPAGLIVMDGGIGWVNDLPVDAVSWGPHPGGLLLMTWVARWRLEQGMAHRGMTLDPDRPIPQLVPMTGDTVPVTVDDLPAGSVPERIRTVALTVAAAWHLMQQPTLAEVARGPVDRSVARSYARAGRPQPHVTIIDLRTVYRPTDPDDSTPDEPGRTYRHRWVVRGHWRDQAHGPGRILRRRIYVPAYLKGPDGAPLLQRERVNVWRR